MDDNLKFTVNYHKQGLTMNKTHRITWYVLVVAGELTGFMTGFGVTRNGLEFWILFVAGVIGMALTLVLAESLYQSGKRQENQ